MGYGSCIVVVVVGVGTYHSVAWGTRTKVRALVTILVDYLPYGLWRLKNVDRIVHDGDEIKFVGERTCVSLRYAYVISVTFEWPVGHIAASTSTYTFWRNKKLLDGHMDEFLEDHLWG